MKAWNGWTATALALAVLGASGCAPAPAATADRGPVAFENYCAPCHGPNANGMGEYAAPAIAGLPAWYIERQVMNFRDGVRGAHVDDLEGLRMRPMSRTLRDHDDVKQVAAYVAALPAPDPEATLHGDAAKGKAHYGTCAACHGQDGKGNEALNAPPLTGLQDWYLVTQLKKFKSGVRGANPKDTTGMQMAPMAATLVDEQAMLDVVAHIQTLK